MFRIGLFALLSLLAVTSSAKSVDEELTEMFWKRHKEWVVTCGNSIYSFHLRYVPEYKANHRRPPAAVDLVETKNVKSPIITGGPEPVHEAERLNGLEWWGRMHLNIADKTVVRRRQIQPGGGAWGEWEGANKRVPYEPIFERPWVAKKDSRWYYIGGSPSERRESNDQVASADALWASHLPKDLLPLSCDKLKARGLL